MPRYADLTGQRFGKLIALRKTEERFKSCVVWECKCDCGQYKKVPTNYLRQGVITSCGCAYEASHQKFAKSRANDLTGQKFGKLLVLQRMPGVTEHNRTLWECKCDCGNVTVVSSGYLLNKPRTQSCGCSHGYRTSRKSRYEAIVGEPVPAGHHIIFLDGDINNWSKSNLYHISNATRMKLYGRGWFFTDAEYTLTAIRICELEEIIKAKQQSK